MPVVTGRGAFTGGSARVSAGDVGGVWSMRCSATGGTSGTTEGRELECGIGEFSDGGCEREGADGTIGTGLLANGCTEGAIERDELLWR